MSWGNVHRERRAGKGLAVPLGAGPGAAPHAAMTLAEGACSSVAGRLRD